MGYDMFYVCDDVFSWLHVWPDDFSNPVLVVMIYKRVFHVWEAWPATNY